MNLNLSCPFICYSYKLIPIEQWWNINKNGSYLKYILYKTSGLIQSELIKTCQ